MKTKLLIISAVAVLVFGGCAKDGEIGPQGPQGPQGVQGTSGTNFTEGGFVMGTVTGTRQDGTPFTFDFNNKYYDVQDYFYLYTAASYYTFYIRRYPVSNSVYSGYAVVVFNLYPLSSTSPLNASMQIYNYQDLGNNDYFLFINTSSLPITFTSFAYDSLSHVATGTFSGNDNGTHNYTGNPATVTGSFQTTMKHHYYRKD